MRAQLFQIICFATLLSGALAAAGAAKLHVYDALGFRFSWSNAKLQTRAGTSDTIVEGQGGAGRQIGLTVVVRKGEKLPQDQDRFRLLSYFPGQWQQEEGDCWGRGWIRCKRWQWAAESGERRGLAMTGWGPAGTYLFVVDTPLDRFSELRGELRDLQLSLEFY